MWEEKVRDQVLARSPSPTAEPHRWRLEDERPSLTHHFKIDELSGYMTVGLYPDGKPGEVFLSVAKQGSFVSGIMDAFVTAVSIGLQHGIPLATFIQKFKYTGFEPSGMVRQAPAGMHEGIFMAKSILDYLFQFLEFRFPGGVLKEYQPTAVESTSAAVESTSAGSKESVEEPAKEPVEPITPAPVEV